jgi:hypothetical protein
MLQTIYYALSFVSNFRSMPSNLHWALNFQTLFPSVIKASKFMAYFEMQDTWQNFLSLIMSFISIMLCVSSPTSTRFPVMLQTVYYANFFVSKFRSMSSNLHWLLNL